MIEQIFAYFPNLSETQKQQLVAIGPLYIDWNQKINVISRKDIDNFYEHHVLHSLAITKVITFIPGSRILDIGTGGGFPGLPLAIMNPEVDFTLVDSVGKKLKVIDAIATDIGLTNITTIHDRAENITGSFDFVVSRAVTKLDITWGWSAPRLATVQNNSLPNGLLYLKGGDISAELPPKIDIKRWEISDMFTEPFFAEKSLVLLSPMTHNGNK